MLQPVAIVEATESYKAGNWKCDVRKVPMCELYKVVYCCIWGAVGRQWSLHYKYTAAAAAAAACTGNAHTTVATGNDYYYGKQYCYLYL